MPADPAPVAVRLAMHPATLDTLIRLRPLPAADFNVLTALPIDADPALPAWRIRVAYADGSTGTLELVARGPDRPAVCLPVAEDTDANR